jgi:hypothetical protein
MGNLVELKVEQPTLPAVGNWPVIVVEDKDSYEFCVQHIAGVKKLYKSIDDKRTELKAPILAAGRGIDGFFKPFLDACLKEESDKKGVALAWKKGEDERVRREQEELNRIAVEEQRALEKKAKAAEKSGNLARAEALREQAAVTGPADAAPADTKVAGSGVRKVWKCRVKNAREFLLHEASASNNDPERFLEIDAVKLAKFVQAGGMLPPGIEAWQEDVMAVRAGVF